MSKFWRLIQIIFCLGLIYIAGSIIWMWLGAPMSASERLFLAVPCLFLAFMFGAEPLETLLNYKKKIR
jgi:hypothetical protein